MRRVEAVRQGKKKAALVEEDSAMPAVATNAVPAGAPGAVPASASAAVTPASASAAILSSAPTTTPSAAASTAAPSAAAPGGRNDFGGAMFGPGRNQQESSGSRAPEGDPTEVMTENASEV